MGIEQRQGPIYIHAVQSKAYRDGWDRIFSKDKKETGPVKKTPAAKQTSKDKVKTGPSEARVKPGRGRPKGSKNKKTLQLEAEKASAAITANQTTL